MNLHFTKFRGVHLFPNIIFFKIVGIQIQLRLKGSSVHVCMDVAVAILL